MLSVKAGVIWSVVGYTFNPSTQKADAGSLKFKVNLVYRAARGTQRNFLEKQNKKQTKIK